MSIVLRAAVALTSFCAMSMGVSLAQTPEPASAPAPTPGIVWESDYDAALARAKQENKPLFVAFLMDNEPANDKTIKENYADPDVVKLSAKYVCLACCIGTHKDDTGMCSKFKGITCAQHEAIEKKARARWLVGNEVCAPQHVFCNPQGDVLLRKVYFIDIPTLKKGMAIGLNDGHDPDAAAALAAEKALVDGWLRDSQSNNLEVREKALQLLANSDDPRALPTILELTKPSVEITIRLAAIGSLAAKGNYLAVKPLTELLGDQKAQIVIRLATTLETIQMPDATPELLRVAKKERRDRVLGYLLRAAARSSPTEVAVRDACLKALKGASAQLTPCVLIALGQLQPHEKIPAAVRPLLKEKNPDTRALAVWVLGAQGTAECGEVIKELLKNEKRAEVIGIATKAHKKCLGEKVEGYESAYVSFFHSMDY